MKCMEKEFGKDFTGKLNDINKIKECATGFRAKYIFEANKKINDNYFAKLKKKNYEDAKKELMKLPGIGEKVADCICLFSLGKTEAFPVDIWMERIMKKLYGQENNKKIRQFAQQKWGKNA